MGAFFSYLLYSALFLLAGYLGYKIAMSGRCSPRVCRTVIWLIYALSFAAYPLSQLSYLTFTGITAGRPLAEMGGAIPAINGVTTSGSVKVIKFIFYIYLTGVFAFAAHTAYSYWRLRHLIASGDQIQRESYILVLLSHNHIAPFSWQNYIVINREDYYANGQIILCHEEKHLDSRHWLDLFVSQIICIIEWFNPAVWLLREELRNAHEYEADSKVIESGVNARQYQLLLIKKAVGARFPSLANSLNHSKLKKRIAMMCNQTKSPARKWRALALVPALAAALAVSNVPQVQASLRAISVVSLTADKVTETSVPVQDVAPKVNSDSAPETPPQPDVLPEFPGGQIAMFEYMMRNLVYPQEAIDANQEGKVAVSFTVLSDGKIGEVKVQKSCGDALDREAMRVVSSMPAWSPARSGGKAVNCSMVIPVMFKLTAQADKK